MEKYEINTAIVQTIENGFTDLANMIIKEYDKNIRYSEVTLLPVSERHVLIRRALDVVVSILNNPDSNTKSLRLYQIHTAKSKNSDDRGSYLARNALANAFFIMSCTVEFCWDRLPENVPRKRAVKSIMKAYETYTGLIIESQLDSIRNEIGESARSAAVRDFDNRRFQVQRAVKKELAEQRDIVSQIMRLVENAANTPDETGAANQLSNDPHAISNSTQAIHSKEPPTATYLLIELLCRQQALQNDVCAILNYPKETDLPVEPTTADQASGMATLGTRQSGGEGANVLAPSQNEQEKPPFWSLTPREQQVADLAIDGLSNQQIAEELCISERTVKNHLRSVYQKLQIDSRAKLIAFGIHRRVIPFRN